MSNQYTYYDTTLGGIQGNTDETYYNNLQVNENYTGESD